MECHACGADARPGQKFCMECGASLRGVSDTTGEVPVIRSQTAASDQVRDEVTRAMGTTQTDAERPDAPAPSAFPPPPPDQWARPGDDEPPSDDIHWQEDPDPTSPAVVPGQPDGQWRRSEPATAARPGVADDADHGWRREPDEAPAREWRHDPHATVQMPLPAADAEATATMRTDRRADAGWASTTAELPVDDRRRRDVATGEHRFDDTSAHRRRSFRLSPVLVLAVLAGAATVAAVALSVLDISTTAGLPPVASGVWKVNDFGTNNAVAALIAAGVMLAGGVLWCFGFRWGAGLAGGAGAALAGWAALMIGLAEFQLFRSRQLADLAASDATRPFGYWAVAATGGFGALALLASFAGSGRDRQGGLDPWIAALGAAAFLVAAGGPLIPLGTADVSANYSSDTLGADLPTAFFVGRLVQLGLLAFCGVIGFLLVRRYGLGLAIGGAVAAAWMLVTAATEQTTNPIGPGYANPGAVDLRPHGVTIVGMALAGFFALVAVVMALLDSE